MNTRAMGKARHNQHWIYRRLIKLGHCKEVDYNPKIDGVCHGLACAAIEAILLFDFSEFDRLIKLSNTLQSDLFSSRAIAIDILTKLNGLYEKIINLQNQQPNNRAARLNIQIEGISFVEKTCGVYTEQDLRYYFDSLSATIRQMNNLRGKPITLYIENREHAICVSYDVRSNLWHFICADNLPIKHFLDVDELAKSVVSSIFCSEKTAIMTISLYCRKNDVSAFKQMAVTWTAKKEWRKLHTFTAEQNATTDSLGANLLLVLMLHNLTAPAKALLENGADPNSADSNRNSVLQLAIKRDQIDIVRLLCRKGVDSNFVNNDGMPEIFYAIKRGNPEIVKILLQHNQYPKDAFTINKNRLIDHCLCHNISTESLIDYPEVISFSMEEYAMILEKRAITAIIREYHNQRPSIFKFPDFISFLKRPREEDSSEERPTKRPRFDH